MALHYKRNDGNFVRGTFRVRGDTVEVYPSHLEDRAWRVSMFGDEVETITEFDPLTGTQDGRARDDQDLCLVALCDAEADARSGGEADQGGSGHPAG